MQTQLIKDPIYQQLNKALCELIQSGKYKVGDRFLTERQISEQYGVSRATANKALSSLVSQGVLEFKKGIGTFVQSGMMDYDLRALVSFTDKARAAGKEPSTRVLNFETVRAGEVDKRILDRLGVEEEEKLFYVERLRLMDNMPVILERRHVVARFCPDLKKTMLIGSLYALWTDRYALEITEADQIVRAVSIRGGDAKLLEVSNGTAGLLVLGEGRLRSGEVLWWEQTLYRGDAYEFRNRLESVSNARTAATGIIVHTQGITD